MASAKYFVADFKDAVARRTVSKTRVLFVEGSDELWFFDHFLDTLSAKADDVQIIDYGGTGNFEVNLKNLVRENLFLDDDVRALGIVQDADRSRTKREYDLSHKFAQIIEAPELKVGVMSKVVKRSNLHVGAFLLPKAGASGNLDTLMLGTKSADEAIMDAQSYLAKHDQSAAEDQDKRIVQIFLSTRKELCRGPGFAARQSYFDLTSAEMNDLKAFITSFLTI